MSEYNFDNVYFRMISVGLTKTLSRCLSYINYFDDSKIRVVIPFYMSVAGSERFVIDAFVDDVVGSRVELNTDQLPKGIISFNGFNTVASELANSNQYISKNTEVNGKMINFLSKTKGIPVRINYDVVITVINEIDVFKISEKIMSMLFNYFYFNINYFSLKLDCSFNLPDDRTIEIVREQNLEADTKKHIKFPLVVNSYYPSFYLDTDQYEICDNDDDLDWSRICFKRPSLLDPIEMANITPPDFT